MSEASLRLISTHRDYPSAGAPPRSAGFVRLGWPLVAAGAERRHAVLVRHHRKARPPKNYSFADISARKQASKGNKGSTQLGNLASCVAAQSSPSKHFVLSDHKATTNIGARLTRQQLRETMHRKFVKMSVSDFMKNFLPGEPPDMPNFERAFSGMPSKGAIEAYFYEPFILTRNIFQKDAVNDADMCPCYKVAITQYKPDLNDSSKQKPDAALYPVNEVPTDARPNWNTQRLHFEFKRLSEQHDPLNDKPKSELEPDSQERADVRGQCISYAEMLLMHQQRAFCFTVAILGREARIFRWDRSGAIATERFNYITELYLCEFLWRFAHLSPEEQGDDLTAIEVEPNSEEARLMREMAKPVEERCGHAHKYFAESLDPSWKWWKLLIDVKDDTPGADADHKVLGEYLVGKSRFSARGVADEQHCSTKTFVWLKDALRVDHDGMEKEGDILHRLNELKIRNVPTLLQHGDVLQHGDILRQRNLSQDHWKAPASRAMMQNPLKSHTRYRLVEKEVCRPLSDFDPGDACLRLHASHRVAHKQAMEKAHLTHHDISGGNLLINEYESVDPFGKPCTVRDGILGDWELSKPIPLEGDTSNRSARQPGRTGTRQFMSVNALNDPWRTIVIQDELESFFHVLLYYGARYLAHNFLDVTGFLHWFFDANFWDVANAGFVCGLFKDRAMHTGVIRHEQKILKFDDGTGHSHPLNSIMTRLLGWFKAHYTISTPGESSPQSDSNREAAGPSYDYETLRRWEKLKASVDLSPYYLMKAKVDDIIRTQDAQFAGRLTSHAAMSTLLANTITDHVWPINDKKGHQLHANFNYETEKHYERTGTKRTHESIADPELPVAASSNKRARAK
ncbi:hypothetical protein BKA93DRAFT_881244 [Sparassis latifolia]